MNRIPAPYGSRIGPPWPLDVRHWDGTHTLALTSNWSERATTVDCDGHDCSICERAAS